MIILIFLAALVVLVVLGGLAHRRSQAIQSDPNFAASDHVEVDRFGERDSRAWYPTETHHDDDPPSSQPGD